ncbi:hypothetical protein BDR07DRAFT_1426185 [Suillus spraguei]|nr:hypothetical protein BDR07DRAFT_1445747 [Suillus spraguei]KAG2351712.1 hypothetical protein BDR07DRAFT_1442256 [Suillus spraguei]KAG2355474.1 hypothetical protein BDR07DRAFT_1426185 [Suillus spraguei]
MSSVVPWDGTYRIQNVAYPEQKIGLRYHDIIVAGRHEDTADPRIDWEIKAISVGDDSKITITSGSRFIGADSEKVVYNNTPYEWGLSYRDVGRWAIRDTASGLLLYLPDNKNGTEVQLTRDGAGEVLYWRFIPIRPPSN